MTREELQQLSVAELEQISYRLTAERQQARKQGILVQQVMSDKIEAERVAKMLGKPAPQTIQATGIESETVVNGG